MKVAKILKVCAIIVWVLGFIMGLLPIITSASLYDSSFYSYSSFINWTLYLYAAVIWFGFFVAGMTQYGFAVMLENVALMRQRTEEQLYYLTGAVQHLEGAAAQKNSAGNNAK